MQQAHTPTIDRLIEAGAHTFTAQTVEPSITLPTHFSLFTSEAPYSHNVTTNTGRPAPSPAAFGLLELLAVHRKRAAAFYSWEHLRNLSAPGSLCYSLCWNIVDQPDGDMQIAEKAGDYISTARPDFSFVYLERTDFVGHEAGWMSRAYMKAVESADTALGLLLERTGFWLDINKDTHVIVQSDHGGDGHHHRQGGNDSMTIPWIAAGPNIQPGTVIQKPITILDTAPTLARILDVPCPPQWSGRPIDEIFLDTPVS
jgi:predicted AlkP superfamily pyrophosphatase or phosphodiesterase